MPTDDFKTLTIEDADGRQVELTIYPWGARDQIKMVLRLTSLVDKIKPDLAPLSDVLSVPGLMDRDHKEILTAYGARLFGSMAGGLSGLAGALLQEGSDALLRDLLKGVIRHPAGGKGERPERPEVFDRVYQCNLGELVPTLSAVLSTQYGSLARLGKQVFGPLLEQIQALGSSLQRVGPGSGSSKQG